MILWNTSTFVSVNFTITQRKLKTDKMRRFYLSAVATLLGATALAQVSVTFRVDMTGQAVSPNGVHVAGNWQAAAGYPGDWQPGTAQMTDANMDGIYELTVSLPPGDYRYKYINGNNWGPGIDESIPEVARIGNDRGFAITSFHALSGFTLPAVLFGGAAPAGKVAVKLSVDLSLQGTISPLGVHVAGEAGLIGAMWTPAFGTMSSVGGGIFSYIAYTTPGTYSFKYINGDDWGMDEWSGTSSPSACTSAGNRTISVSENTIAPLVCFAACEPCVDPAVVTFLVDMSNVGCANPLGAHIAGQFNGWSGQPMTDAGNGIYSISFTLQPGTYNFKFQDGPGGWEGAVSGDCAVPGGVDRTVVVQGGDVTYGPYCFGTCSSNCEAAPEESTITFRVDMSAQVASPAGVWLMGSFTSPAWQGGAIAMNGPNADGIYEATAQACGPITFEYKYVNGAVNTPSNEEFHGNPTQLPCNISNNQGGWNRVHVRQGGIEIKPVEPFGACATVNTNNAEFGRVRLYPNPTSTGFAVVEMENPNGYSLRLNVLDVTGKTIIANVLLNNNRFEVQTGSLAPGLYFLDVANQNNERTTYKLMVQ